MRSRICRFRVSSDVWTTRFDFDLAVARNVNSIVAIELKRLAACPDCRFPVEADQSDFVLIAIERDRRMARVQSDAAIVQVTRRGWTRRQRVAVPSLRASSVRNKFLV